MDYEALPAASDPHSHLPNKQGFRFHKSGSVSPIPPPPQSVQQQREEEQQQRPTFARIPSHPTLISEISSSSSSSYSSASPSACIGSGASAGGEISPSGVDPKLHHIIKRITSCTPSLLISSSTGKYQTLYLKTSRVKSSLLSENAILSKCYIRTNYIM